MLHLIATGFSLAIGYAAFELAAMAALTAINGFFLLCGAVFSTKPVVPTETDEEKTARDFARWG